MKFVIIFLKGSLHSPTVLLIRTPRLFGNEEYFLTISNVFMVIISLWLNNFKTEKAMSAKFSELVIVMLKRLLICYIIRMIVEDDN